MSRPALLVECWACDGTGQLALPCRQHHGTGLCPCVEKFDTCDACEGTGGCREGECVGCWQATGEPVSAAPGMRYCQACLDNEAAVEPFALPARLVTEAVALSALIALFLSGAAALGRIA